MVKEEAPIDEFDEDGFQLFSSERQGYLVETGSGKRGLVKGNEPYINGKLAVYTEDGKKLLCDPKKVKLIGFQD